MAQRVLMSEYWYLYGQTFRQMGRFSLWVPLIIHGALALGLALMHYHVFAPVTGSIIGGWTRLLNAEYAPMFIHYPGHFALMPHFFGTARLVINAFTEAFLFGIVLDLLIALYRGERPVFMISVSRALRRYLQLTVVWLVVIGVLYIIGRYANAFVEDVLGYSLLGAPRRLMMTQMITRGVTIIVYAVCVFLLPSIMVGGVSLWGALKRGFKMFVSHPIIAVGLVFIPYLIGFLPSLIMSDPNKIVSNFYPELIFYLILFSIGLDVIVNFILLGTSLKFYMDRSS
jgi:hypothetical protein